MTTSKTTEVRCAAAPAAGGHYAQGVVRGDSLYVSGQLGLARGMAIETSVSEQVAFALGNIERIAHVVGADRGDVVKCTVFVAGIERWEEADRAYAAFFRDHRPARSIVPCGSLHLGCRIEIEAIVAVGG